MVQHSVRRMIHRSSMPLVPRQAAFALAATLVIVDIPNLNSVGHAGQCALNAAIGNGSRSARRGLQAAVSAEVPGEEPQRGVQLECRDFPVLAWVGVQRLLG
jgi:hypothetical protein